MMTFPPMRSQMELQRVHDILNDVLSDARLVHQFIPPGHVQPLMLVADCLCWALHHDGPGCHGSHFAEIMKALEESLAEFGHEWAMPRQDYIVEE